MTQKIALALFSLALGVILMAVKFGAWWWTNSNAILTDALESIINVVAGAFALFSLWLADRPRDRNHPYGHGKIEFVSAGFEGALIALAGLGIIGKSIYNLFEPQPIAHLDLGLLLTLGAGLLNGWMGWLLVRRGRALHSLTMVASGRHLLTDAWSSAGLVIGLLLIEFSGLVVLDSVIALGFGLFILYTGYRLVRRSLAGILDEADYGLIRRLVAVLHSSRRPAWIDVHNLRTIEYGADLHIDCHLTLPWYFNVREAHAEVKAFEERCRANTERGVELFIHVDPCEPPFACHICQKMDCGVRKAPFDTPIEWTLENVMQNQKHFAAD